MNTLFCFQVPQDPSTLRKNIYFCPSCNQYLPSIEFALSSNSRTVGKCRKCAKIDNDARTRQDISTYQYMLKSLRKAEELYSDDSKIAFLLQVHLTINSILKFFKINPDFELVEHVNVNDTSLFSHALVSISLVHSTLFSEIGNVTARVQTTFDIHAYVDCPIHPSCPFFQDFKNYKNVAIPHWNFTKLILWRSKVKSEDDGVKNSDKTHTGLNLLDYWSET